MHQWRMNGSTPYMTLTSTGLGIGTTAPDALFHIKGATPSQYVEDTSTNKATIVIQAKTDKNVIP